ncbi:MAG TPA: PD-(D/E)XK nuclease family protein, partial [Candidatus Limnocylindria bacterium]|nr:PD-(D/E)XK nuclease family protein [Candidatus Limnocylindria bacterium]
MTHVSPSQIETWRGCQRRWAYSRIRPRHDNPWAAFGTRVHTILERWLELRETPDHTTPEGRCALAAVPEIPLPQSPGSAVEHAFAFVSDGTHLILADLVAPKTATCHGHTATGKDDPDALANAARAAAAALGDPWVAYVGRIDLLDHVPGTYVRVTDYKSCGDLARADETRGDFEENVQRIIYAVYVRERFGVESVVARW